MANGNNQGKLLAVFVGFPLLVVGGIVLAISLLGQPVGVPNPKYLTPELFGRIRNGDTSEAVAKLLPNPRPTIVHETTEVKVAGGPGQPEVVEWVWKEFGIGGTYGTFIEFRIQFQDGKVIGKEQRGP